MSEREPASSPCQAPPGHWGEEEVEEVIPQLSAAQTVGKRATDLTPSLCETCRHLRAITTPKGSRFLLCQLSVADARYPKYPPQPIVRCPGYQPRDDADKSRSGGPT